MFKIKENKSKEKPVYITGIVVLRYRKLIENGIEIQEPLFYLKVNEVEYPIYTEKFGDYIYKIPDFKTKIYTKMEFTSITSKLYTSIKPGQTLTCIWHKEYVEY